MLYIYKRLLVNCSIVLVHDLTALPKLSIECSDIMTSCPLTYHPLNPTFLELLSRSLGGVR